MTHRIDTFLWLSELNFFQIWLKEMNFFFKYDSTNWFFLSKKKMTQRIECFSIFHRELIFLWLKGLNFFTTQRIEPFFVWLKELNPFSSNMTQRIEPFSHLPQRIEFFFSKYDSKNWTFFLWYDSKNWIFFWEKKTRIEPLLFKNMTQRIEPCVKKKDSKNWTLLKWLIELNLFLWTFSQYDSKSWNLFAVWLQEFNFSCVPIWLKELNLFFQVDSKNCVFFWFDSKNWTFFFWIWLKELNLFYWLWLKELNLFWVWLQGLNLFFIEYDSKSWTSFWVWLKELNLFLSMTQRLLKERSWRNLHQGFCVRLHQVTWWRYPFFLTGARV